MSLYQMFISYVNIISVGKIVLRDFIFLLKLPYKPPWVETRTFITLVLCVHLYTKGLISFAKCEVNEDFSHHGQVDILNRNY